MNRFKTYGLIGLCAFGVVATLDSAFGLGGSALLADICMTILEGDSADAGMADMPMEVKPVPIIAISLAATAAAIFALAQDHQKLMTGRSEPNDEERASILSAMLLVSAAQGRTSREEMLDVFRIVTHHELAPDLLDVAYERFHMLAETDLMQHRLPSVSSRIGRRRTLAAALMLGCVARPSNDAVTAVIERIAIDIGATSEDISIARRSLESWKDGCPTAAGVSLVTVLRHRGLELSPA